MIFSLLLPCFVFLVIDEPEDSYGRARRQTIVNFQVKDHTLVLMSGSPIKVQCDHIKRWDLGEVISHGV